MIYIINADEPSAEKMRSYFQFNNFQDVKYDFQIKNDVLTIGINIVYPENFHFEDDSFDIQIPIKKYAGQYIIVKILKDLCPEENPEMLMDHYLYPVLDFNCAHLYSRGYDVKDIGSQRFVSMYITKDANDVYVHPFYRLNNDQFEAEGITYIEKPMIHSDHIGMLLSSCQEFKDYYDKWNIKKESLDPAIDISKSAAYLETEVDTLYKIVELLLQKTNIDVTEYRPIMDAVARHNVLDIKNINKLVSEIDEDKANIRARQADFYKEAYE